MSEEKWIGEDGPQEMWVFLDPATNVTGYSEMGPELARPGERAVHFTRATQWQPIESAPLDTDILVFLMDEHLGPMFRVVFNSCSGEWSDGLDVYSPTHWQPLPAPPEVK
ncbi:DUF551 domain-containing protein [Stenotrophomonas sp.]|uniref:DUF551 domain-containing protein n=1 Tax=Stenotrophomonas sp. TaxID=69392 RepID=UPI0028A21B8A|nr:DUF551 domain-containing protein [Stenotrophomonas sp.]